MKTHRLAMAPFTHYKSVRIIRPVSRPTRIARIEHLAAEVQQRIVSCPNEQTFDDGDTIWIFGCPTSLRDLLGNANVPEDLEDEVTASLACPKCNSPLETWQDVGTKYAFELNHEGILASAAGKYYEPLIQFREFLNAYPSLGAMHPVGKRILREVERFPKSVFSRRSCFRARSIKDVSDPTPNKWCRQIRRSTEFREADSTMPSNHIGI